MSECSLSIPRPCPSAREFGGQLCSDEGSRSLSSSGGILVVGEDTSNEDSKDQEPLSLILISCRDLLFHERRAVARGGRCYSSPLAKG
jgi:hypothetical protein